MAKNKNDKIAPLGEHFAPVKTVASARASFFARHRRGVLVTAILVVALLLAAAAVAVLYVNGAKQQADNPAKTDTSKAVNSEGDELAMSVKAQSVIEKASTTANNGDSASAATTLTEAAKSTNDNDDKVAYYSKATTIQLNAGAYDAAIASSQAAIDADPNNYLLYSNLGYVYVAAERNADAISSFQKAIEVFNANPGSEATNTNGGTAGLKTEIERLQQS